MKTQYAAKGFRVMAVIFLLVCTVLMLGGGPTWAAPLSSRWGANYFPNIPLLTQDGETVHFYDDLIKDKVVAINFIYTHCGDTCPLETANLRQVQKLLADRVGKDVFFYSISIDPEHDTPETLKEYAARFNVGPGWTFLTGTKADTTLIRQRLGLYREEAEANKLAEHNVSFMIGNEATGQWIKRSPFDEPKVLAHLLGDSLQRVHTDNAGAASYAEAPRLATLNRGADLFRSRCDSCHSLGTEDGLGPGLLGIAQKRDRTWLARWLKEPDKMLAEKDPIASQLFDTYNKLPMPNLRLKDTDVEALIIFMSDPAKRTDSAAVDTGEVSAGN